MRALSAICTVAVGGMLALMSAEAEAASTVIDTTSTSSAQQLGFGGSGGSSVGQSFIAPADPVLHHITLHLNEEGPPIQTVVYEVAVMGWAGDRAVGNVLFRSGVASTNGLGSIDIVSIDTGGIVLIPGEDYIVFVTTLGGSYSAENTLHTFETDTNVYPGGNLFFHPGPSDEPFESVTHYAWFGWEESELATILEFEPIPEPTTAALLAVIGLALLRRR